MADRYRQSSCTYLLLTYTEIQEYTCMCERCVYVCVCVRGTEMLVPIAVFDAKNK